MSGLTSGLWKSSARASGFGWQSILGRADHYSQYAWRPPPPPNMHYVDGTPMPFCPRCGGSNGQRSFRRNETACIYCGFVCYWHRAGGNSRLVKPVEDSADLAPRPMRRGLGIPFNSRTEAAAYHREYRAVHETEEQYQRRLERQRERGRRDRDREWSLQWRAEREKKEESRKKRNEYKARWREDNPEGHEAELEYFRERYRRQMSEMTAEERRAHNAKKAEATRKRRARIKATETPKQRKARKTKERAGYKARRAAETPEQRERRLEYLRNYKRTRKARRKAEKEKKD